MKNDYGDWTYRPLLIVVLEHVPLQESLWQMTMPKDIYVFQLINETFFYSSITEQSTGFLGFDADASRNNDHVSHMLIGLLAK